MRKKNNKNQIKSNNLDKLVSKLISHNNKSIKIVYKKKEQIKVYKNLKKKNSIFTN
jgi:hypothetical protein